MVVVDIDGGTVLVPDSVVVPELPKFLSKSFYRMLLKVSVCVCSVCRACCPHFVHFHDHLL